MVLREEFQMWDVGDAAGCACDDGFWCYWVGMERWVGGRITIIYFINIYLS